MQKIIITLFLTVFVLQIFAQVSFNTASKTQSVLKKYEDDVVRKFTAVAITALKTKREMRKFVNKTDSIIKDSVKKILQRAEAECNEFILSDVTINKDSVLEKMDTITNNLVKYQRDKIRLLKYWFRYNRAEDRENKFLNFLPAYYAVQSKRFFEGDTTHKKFFAANSINYSPINKKMVLYTEVVNDYFGPFRLDIGFTLRSKPETDTTKAADSAKAIEKRDDLISALQNGGGDISFSTKLPLLSRLDNGRLFNFKMYSFFNVGFALPVVNEATKKFFANYDFGVDGFLFAKGFDNKITFFAQSKTAYYFGNRAFRQIIREVNDKDPTSFFLGQAALGLDFLDGFRFRVDFYYGNRFVKDNFPTTVTFIIRPGYKKAGN